MNLKNAAVLLRLIGMGTPINNIKFGKTEEEFRNIFFDWRRCV